jgi:predicted SnoaL-like aldol condensation-catalyzing enzyme
MPQNRPPIKMGSVDGYLHGRFSGFGAPVAWIVVDIVRIENGQLAEHWDVIQDEATRDGSKSGLPMFGDSFPN